MRHIPANVCLDVMKQEPSEPTSRGWRVFGFDLDWMPNSDFKVYLSDDESKPITGKVSDHTELRPWGPDGIELHMYYDPA